MVSDCIFIYAGTSNLNIRIYLSINKPVDCSLNTIKLKKNRVRALLYAKI